jgi:transcriptional regulator with GAF, ATPase, and Fis domain
MPSINYTLESLKSRLEQVNSSWTTNDYESLLKFYVDIVPKIMNAERCSIFISEQSGEEIWLKFGTGLKEKELTPPKEGTVVGKTISTGKWIIENELGMQPGYHTELISKTGYVTNNLICAPIKSLTQKGVIGAIEVLNKQGGEQFSKEDGAFLQKIADYLSMAIENIHLNQEILKISNKLNNEIDNIWNAEKEFIAESSVMKNILHTVHSISATPVNVLIFGESGTGKELIARMIQKCSDRRDNPFVPVNCAAVPENLVESEFFGHEKGAFTGAASSRKGRFEEAHEGILFLDEIGDMPMVMQPKFLRVIQEGEGSKLGSNKVNRYDLRFISATNKDLRKEVASGNFREDLFYRIFSVEIYIPPLRERKDDIVPLAILFLNNVSKRFHKKSIRYSQAVLNFFEDYHWPGNVRQLQHEVERLIALTPEGQQVLLRNCSTELQNWKNSSSIIEFKNLHDLAMPAKVKELEISCIKDALNKSDGNKRQASEILGITRQGLDKKIKRYNIPNLSKSNG